MCFMAIKLQSMSSHKANVSSVYMSVLVEALAPGGLDQVGLGQTFLGNSRSQVYSARPSSSCNVVWI